MAKCLHCRDRKGKRSCPHLNGLICAACCGENRLTKFPCPEDCVYLQNADTYRRQRAAPEIRQKYNDRYAGYLRADGDRLANDAYFLESLLYRAAGHGRADDADLLEALSYVRRSMSAIAMVEQYPTPLGRELLAEVDQAIPKEAAGRRDEIAAAAERLIEFMKSESGCGRGERTYAELLGLAGATIGFDKTIKKQEEKRSPSGLILP